MSAVRGRRARIRYEERSLRSLGIPDDSRMLVHEVHLDGFDTLEEAVDIYQGVFGLSEGARIDIRATPCRTVIDGHGGGTTLVRTRGNDRTLSSEMVIHR